MSLKLYARPTGIWHIRGSVQGVAYDQSARTRVKSEAEAIRVKLEAEAFKRAVYGAKAVATFAEAVIGYREAGGAKDHLKALVMRFGDTPLREIKQATVDRAAREMKPDAKPATLVRQIYTPMSAVMNFAASQDLCDPVKFRKPKVANNRVEFLTPQEAADLIALLPPQLAGLVTFYLATGCRATEALQLQWRDVDPGNGRVVFWDTKMAYPRGVNLPQIARDALPERGAGPVFLNSRGEPWHSYDAINLMLKRYATKAKFRPVHCHLFRHTWATWAYACTRDMTYLMGQGGWKSANMVMRYSHTAGDGLAMEVLAAGWAFDGREIFDRAKLVSTAHV
jgi:integrase